MILAVGDALSHQPAYSLCPGKTDVLGLSGKTKVAANDKNAPMNNSLTLQLCSVIITALEAEDTVLEICDETCGGRASACPHAGLLFFYTTTMHFLSREMFVS